nr:SPRY domain-containing protein [Clostridium mobile]
MITWNPNDKGKDVILSLNNMEVSAIGYDSGIRATKGYNYGKYYMECKIVDVGAMVLGIANKQSSLSWLVNGQFGNDARAYSCLNATKYPENKPYGDKIISGEIIGMAVDLDKKIVEFFKNGMSMGVAFNDVGLLQGDIYAFIINSSVNYKMNVQSNFGANEFDIITSNPNEWSRLVYEGYRPYDFDNAIWFSYSHLIKQSNEYYTTNNNYYKLGTPKDKTELKRWLSEYGTNNILNLQDSLNNKIVPVDKFSEPRKIYQSLDVDFNDVKKPYVSMIDMDLNKRLDYDADSYKIIDEIRKVNNGIGNVVFKEY